MTLKKYGLPHIGLESQSNAAVGAPGVAQDAPAIDEGVHTDPAPEQALQQPPPPSPATARTMPQRMARLEEDVREIRGALTKQREMMDKAGVTYTSYFETPGEYQRRRVRQRTGEASTSTAQQDQQQPDP
ncbi:hypothetical protein Tco_0181689 [Tanacetum coccineum]